MKTSTDRILTTHVGSLPRPPQLTDVLLKRDRGEAYDAAELKTLTSAAVDDIIARQVAVGIDIVSDGETSKAGYGTYIKERLSGFSNEHFKPRPQSDFKDFPACTNNAGPAVAKEMAQRLSCTRPVKVIDDKAVQADIANFKSALKKTPAKDAFMNAVSPGTIAHFQPNRYYKTMEEYFEAAANAMRPEYEAIVNAASCCRSTAPISRCRSTPPFRIWARTHS